jgi:hypothetical protein
MAQHNALHPPPFGFANVQHQRADGMGARHGRTTDLLIAQI